MARPRRGRPRAAADRRRGAQPQPSRSRRRRREISLALALALLGDEEITRPSSSSFVRRSGRSVVVAVLLASLLAITAFSFAAAAGESFEVEPRAQSSNSVSALCESGGQSESCNSQLEANSNANSRESKQLKAAGSQQDERSALSDESISAPVWPKQQRQPVPGERRYARRPLRGNTRAASSAQSGSGASGGCVFGFAGNGRISSSDNSSEQRCVDEREQSANGSGERDELIELLAELYAHTKLVQDRLALELLLDSREEWPPKPANFSAQQTLKDREDRLRLEMGADEESLLRWLRQRQLKYSSLQNTTLELLQEQPNRTIIVCEDGPKILVLPDKSDILYCYTSEQWHTKLWSDIENSLSAWHNYPIIILNVLIFLFGTTGNIFVCLSVYKNHQLRNVTNYFIVNLAFADFLVILICLPATVVWDLSLTWFFGTMPCKLIMFLQDVSISVSVLTLTAISIDRYYAICYPLSFKSNLSQAKKMIALIWLVSLLIMAPDLIYLRARESEELSEAGLATVLYSDCNYDWSHECSRLFQFVKTILLYLLPFLLMFVAHYKILQALEVASACLPLVQPPPIPAQPQVSRGRRIGGKRLSASFQRPCQLLPPAEEVPTSAINEVALSLSLPPPTSRLVELQSDMSACSSSSSSSSESSNCSAISVVPAKRGLSSPPSSADDDDDKELHEEEEDGRRGLCSSVKSSIRRLVASATTSERRQKGQLMRQLAKGRALPVEENGSVGGKAKPKTRTNRGQGMVRETSLAEQTTTTTTTTARGEGKQINSNSADKLTRFSSSVSAAVRVATAADAKHRQQLIVTMHNKSKLESRRAAAKMLMTIVVLFGICYLPVHLINFLRQFIENIPQTDVTSTISMLAHCVCYLNSAINPIIYNHMNSIFRAEFKKFLSSCLCWLPRQQQQQQPQTNNGRLPPNGAAQPTQATMVAAPANNNQQQQQQQQISSRPSGGAADKATSCRVSLDQTSLDSQVHCTGDRK